LVTKSQVTSTNEWLGHNELSAKNPANQKQIYNALYIAQDLYKNGFNLNAIAGMLGNITLESTLNPGLWEDFVGPGFGIVQWTPASNLTDWCKKKGYDPKDIDSQLKRIYYEVEHEGLQWIKTKAHNMSFKDFKKSTSSPEDLTLVFLKNYERAGVEKISVRQQNARYWYDYITKNSMIGFKPRKSGVKSGSKESKYYTNSSYSGGVNPCIIGNDGSGNPLWTGSVLPNCVGYAWGRAYELMGKAPRLSTGGAGGWFDYNKNNKIYEYSTDRTKPRLGAIVCWKGNPDGGHVAVVEEINEKDNYIVTSNYGWQYKPFYTSKFYMNNTFNYKNGAGKDRIFEGYIYLPEIGNSGSFSGGNILGTTFIEKLVKIAETEIGKEGDASKSCKYGAEIDKLHYKIDPKYNTLYYYQKNGADWCAIFVDWCFYRALDIIDENGNINSKVTKKDSELLKIFYNLTNHSQGGAACSNCIDAYKSIGSYFKRGEQTPQPGDEIFFTWGHTGLVVDVKGDTVYTVEGNTGGGGGKVKQGKYSLSWGSIDGYGRPQWEHAPNMDPTQIPPNVQAVYQCDYDKQKNRKGDPLNNDFYMDVRVHCGGIPKITRGVTVDLIWYNPTYKNFMLKESVVCKLDKYESDEDATVSFTTTQFIESGITRNFTICDVDGKVINKNDIQVDIEDIADNFLRGCSKITARATQINIYSDNVSTYKDKSTTELFELQEKYPSRKILATSGEKEVATSCDLTVKIKGSIPCVNIYINNKFKQCIPYIYTKDKSSGKFLWKVAVPYIATTTPAAHNPPLPPHDKPQWKQIYNLRGIETDDQVMYGKDEKGDFYDTDKNEWL
jgi:surface antigen